MTDEPLLLRALHRRPNPRPPIWLMRQAGRYMAEYRAVRERVSFLELCCNPRLCAQVMADAVDILDVDAAIIFSDILPLLLPFGFDLDYLPGDGPVIRNPIRTQEDLLRLPEKFDAARVSFIFETVAETRRVIPFHKAVIGFAGAPFTLASYAIEGGSSHLFARTKTLMRTEPILWSVLMERLADAVGESLLGQVASGADAVQIFDSWAGALAPDEYRTYVFPYMEKILSRIRGRAPVIYFCPGNPALLPEIVHLAVNALSIDWRIPIQDADRLIGPDIAVQGNLDPTVLLTDKKRIRDEAKRILDRIGSRPGFIFNLGHGVLKETPVENVIELVRAVKEYHVP